MRDQVRSTYAIACLLGSGNRYVVAIATIEQHTNNLLNIEYVDNLHAISGRLGKEDSSWSSTRDTGSSPIAATTFITIKDFIGIVNKTQQSILSDDVLRHFEEVRNPEGHWAERAQFSRSDITEMSDTEYRLANRYSGIARDFAFDRLNYYAGENASGRDKYDALKKLYLVSSAYGTRERQYDKVLSGAGL